MTRAALSLETREWLRAAIDAVQRERATRPGVVREAGTIARRPLPTSADGYCEATVNLGPLYEGRVRCSRRASLGPYCRTHAKKRGLPPGHGALTASASTSSRVSSLSPDVRWRRAERGFMSMLGQHTIEGFWGTLTPLGFILVADACLQFLSVTDEELAHGSHGVDTEFRRAGWHLEQALTQLGLLGTSV